MNRAGKEESRWQPYENPEYLPPVFEAIEESDPASLLEAKEEEIVDVETERVGIVLRRVLAWVVEGRTVSKVGYRALILARKLSPDLVDGVSLREIAKQVGQGRSSAHNLDRDLSRLFDLRSPLERPEATRKDMSERWYARHIPDPDR